MKNLLYLIILFVGLFSQNYSIGIGTQIDDYFLDSNSEDCESIDYSKKDFLVVSNIQKFLKENGYFNGNINNIFDENLKDSIKSFQKDIGIKVDGIVGFATFNTMRNYDSCLKVSTADLIQCGDYKSYKRCPPSYIRALLNTTSTTTTTTTTTTTLATNATYDYYSTDCIEGENSPIGPVTFEDYLQLIEEGFTGYDTCAIPRTSGPTISNLNSAISVAENQTSVVTISATGTGSLSYSLSGTDARLMSVNSSGVITLNSNADYEQKTSYSANAIVTDGTESTTKAFTLNVTDVAEKYTVNVLIVYDADNLGDGASDYDTVPELTAFMTDTVVSAQNTMFTNSGITNLEMSFTGLYHWTLAESTYAGAPYNSATTRLSLDFDVYKEKIKTGADSLGGYLPGNGNTSIVWDDKTKRRNTPFVMSSSLSYESGKIFAHEWGHSLGLVHSRNQASNAAETGDGITDYAHGYYVDSGNTFSTTMAYGNVGCGIYSNPDLTCAGDDDTAYFIDDNDGTKGSQAAGEADVSDSSRVLQEYAHEYERLGAETNYGVSVGDYSVKSNAYFPLIDNGTASYSFTESISETSTGTKTIYVKKGSNVTVDGTEYESYTWCDHSSCDLNVISHTASQSSHKIGLEILVNSGNYYLYKVGWSGVYSTLLASANSKDHYDRHFEEPCLFISHYMKTGQYNESDCSTRFAHQSVYGTSYTDTWSFTNNVKKELIVTPYGAYDAYKYTHSELSLTGAYDTDGAVQVLKFWFSPEVGVLMFEDELMRRWKLTAVDTDGDGTDNATDTDDDGDGVLDTADAFPLDPNASADADSDGIADGDE